MGNLYKCTTNFNGKRTTNIKQRIDKWHLNNIQYTKQKNKTKKYEKTFQKSRNTHKFSSNSNSEQCIPIENLKNVAFRIHKNEQLIINNFSANQNQNKLINEDEKKKKSRRVCIN